MGRMVEELDEEEAAFVPWDALSCLALTLKLCRPIVPSADCTTSVAGVYLAKRRTANHPCPVCGKHYVNEGSLRKHLACHPETSQLSTSLRMWPCSVCQAVFTHESGKYLAHVNAKSAGRSGSDGSSEFEVESKRSSVSFCAVNL